MRQQRLWWLAGQTAPDLVRSDDDFAALPASSQQPAAAAGTAAAGSSSLAWNKMQESALHEYVTAVLELHGGRDDNPRLWEDVAANPVLWGPNKVTPAELKEVYLRVSGNLVSLLLMLSCMCLLSKTVHVTGNGAKQQSDASLSASRLYFPSNHMTLQTSTLTTAAVRHRPLSAGCHILPTPTCLSQQIT